MVANLSDIVGVNALSNPMTTDGDIIYGGTSGTPTRLAKGTDGQVLTLASGLPSWAAASGGSLLVAETTVSGSAVTSVTFSGLDGNTDGGYRLDVSFINASSSNTSTAIFLNGDTTSTNYYRQYIWGSESSVSAGRANSANLAAVGGSASVPFTIDILNSNGTATASMFSPDSPASSLGLNFYISMKNTTTSNITRVTFTSSVVSSIAVGSIFRLYKRK